jgi:hypothetical protein
VAQWHSAVVHVLKGKVRERERSEADRRKPGDRLSDASERSEADRRKLGDRLSDASERSAAKPTVVSPVIA